MSANERVLLTTYTIYDHPKDFPNDFVVRRFDNGKPTGAAFTCDTLWQARDLINALTGGQSVCLARDETDDPVIVETWL